MGSRIPEVDLKTFDAGELGKTGVSEITPKDVNTKDIFAKKTVVVFSITGAFTPVVRGEDGDHVSIYYFYFSVLQNNYPDSFKMWTN